MRSWRSFRRGASSVSRSSAVFVVTLHRLFVSGSDRNCADWMESYLIEGSEGLALHHFYRAMPQLNTSIRQASDLKRVSA